MVVLNQSHIVQTDPMVFATAVADRQFLQRTETGSGLACVKYFAVCVTYSINKPAGQGCYAT